MPNLSRVPDHPIAIDLRIGLAEAAEMRRPAAAYSLWPERPFGASADQGVWPSAFVGRDRAAADRISMHPGAAPYWDNFGLWDDVRDMAHHMRPLPVATHVIALGLDTQRIDLLRGDSVLGVLARGALTAETLGMEATLLGYDITDEFLQSAVFDSARPSFDANDVPRTIQGLVESLEAARDLRDRLDTADPAHSPLSCVSVWSLGDRPPTPGG